mgnify:CR=1 FL=1|jgi:small subunit ribosomal protein S9
MPEEVKKKAPVKEVKTEKPAEKEQEEQDLDSKKSEYLYSVGKRKTAIAQVRVYKKGTGKVTINEKDYKKFCITEELEEKVLAPLNIVGQQEKLDVTVKVKGGGATAQAEAIRHGVSKALLQLNPNFRKPLKKVGYLTRDPRKKERKKPGLKRARKAPQWKKR